MRYRKYELSDLAEQCQQCHIHMDIRNITQCHNVPLGKPRLWTCNGHNETNPRICRLYKENMTFEKAVSKANWRHIYC